LVALLALGLGFVLSVPGASATSEVRRSSYTYDSWPINAPQARDALANERSRIEGARGAGSSAVRAQAVLLAPVVAAEGAGAVTDDVLVLGNYPDYVQLADQLGARRFSIPDAAWEAMTPAERWAAQPSRPGPGDCGSDPDPSVESRNPRVPDG